MGRASTSGPVVASAAGSAFGPSARALAASSAKTHWPSRVMPTGWTAYFSYGSCALAYRALEHHIWHRVYYFLRRRHKADRGGNPDTDVFGRRGVLRPRLAHVRP